MSHKRKDTYTKCPEWCKHLRPFIKRFVNKRERLYAKKDIIREILSLDTAR